MWLRVSEYTTSSFSSLICANRRSRSVRLDTSPCTSVALFLDLFDRRRSLALAAPGHENVCALLGEQLCQSQCRCCRQLQARFFQRAYPCGSPSRSAPPPFSGSTTPFGHLDLGAYAPIMRVYAPYQRSTHVTIDVLRRPEDCNCFAVRSAARHI